MRLNVLFATGSLVASSTRQIEAQREAFCREKKMLLADRRIYSSRFVVFSSSCLHRMEVVFSVSLLTHGRRALTAALSEMIRMRMAIRGKSICRDKENCNLLCHGTTQQGFAVKRLFAAAAEKPKRKRKMPCAMHEHENA